MHCKSCRQSGDELRIPILSTMLLNPISPFYSAGWLGYDKAGKRLVVTTTANQDPLFATTGLVSACLC